MLSSNKSPVSIQKNLLLDLCTKCVVRPIAITTILFNDNRTRLDMIVGYTNYSILV